jgi:hypothetical protein
LAAISYQDSGHHSPLFPGKSKEAIFYVLNSGDVWAEAKGALLWLAQTAKNTL